MARLLVKAEIVQSARPSFIRQKHIQLVLLITCSIPHAFP